MEGNNICKISHIRSSDLVCTNLVYEETDVQAQKTHTDKYILGVVVQGNGILNQGNRAYEISKGNAFFIQKDTTFCIDREQKIAYFYISFYGRRADELVERFGLSEEYCVFSLMDSYETLSVFAFDCLHKANDQNTDLLGECGLLYLLAHLDIKKSVCNGLLSNMITQTNNRFTDPTFSLGALSDLLGYDAKYLSFFFKKNKGVCYSQYLRELRIKHSIFLMEQGITSVKNVAILSGFGDALYYSKIFKQETGKSPKDYISDLQSGKADISTTSESNET